MKKILVAIMLVLVLSLSGCGNVFEERRIDAEKKNIFYETVVVDKYIVEYENPSWLWDIGHLRSHNTKFYIVIAYQGEAYDKFVTLEKYNVIQENDIYVISQYYWEYYAEADNG
jgi:uncharacterized lipoprotein NlpE involved in copper resistance